MITLVYYELPRPLGRGFKIKPDKRTLVQFNKIWLKPNFDYNFLPRPEGRGY